VKVVILARWFAFFVIALGLQVPSDLSFRVCLCDGVLGVGLSFEHDCEPAPRPAPSQSCCSEDDGRESPAESTPCESGDRCSCVLVHVPHRPDTSKVAPPTMPLDLAVGPVLVAMESVEALPRSSGVAARSREHDPPWARANVPLRI
jgi:hypothetical protein